MRYLNTVLGLILHGILILIAYMPLFIRCIDIGLYEIYPVFILFWLLSINEMLLSVTPPSVIVLPVCSFSFTMILGFIITSIYPWIHVFLVFGVLIFVLGLLAQFLITLI